VVIGDPDDHAAGGGQNWRLEGFARRKKRVDRAVNTDDDDHHQEMIVDHRVSSGDDRC
jgi:hypothetical protein